MSEERKYVIASAGKEIGAFTARELMRDYNSLLKCEGISVVVDSQPQPLWVAVQKWHGAQKWDEAQLPLPSQQPNEETKKGNQ